MNRICPLCKGKNGKHAGNCSPTHLRRLELEVKRRYEAIRKEERRAVHSIPNKVLMAIQSERAHQNQKWPGHKHTIAEWLLILQKVLDDAKRCWFFGHGRNDLALHEIRQVAATAVAAMEQCGALMREKKREPVLRKDAFVITPIEEEDYNDDFFEGKRTGVGKPHQRKKGAPKKAKKK